MKYIDRLFYLQLLTQVMQYCLLAKCQFLFCTWLFNFLDANLMNLFVSLLLGLWISFVDSSNNGTFCGVLVQFWHDFQVFPLIFLQPHPGFIQLLEPFQLVSWWWLLMWLTMMMMERNFSYFLWYFSLPKSIGRRQKIGLGIFFLFFCERHL